MTDRESLVRAVYMNPRCMVARSVLADHLEDIGEPDEAAAYLERRRVWPYTWWSSPDPMYCWFPDDALPLRDVERPAALPIPVYRHLRASRGGGAYSVIAMFLSVNDALDGLSEAAARAFGLVARPAAV